MAKHRVQLSANKGVPNKVSSECMSMFALCIRDVEVQYSLLHSVHNKLSLGFIPCPSVVLLQQGLGVHQNIHSDNTL